MNLVRKQQAEEKDYIHPVGVSGIAEKTTIEFIVRDFETQNLAKHEARLRSIAENLMKNYPKASMQFKAHEQLSQHERSA
jgi:tripeptide aminopeptidase